MEVSLRVLRYAVAAAEKGQVTEAARTLNVSQPSVSSAMADLEDAVGVQVFVRHHARGVTLTPAGKKIILEARLLLRHASDFVQNAVELGTTLKGEISIGCFQTLAVRFLPQLLSGFTRKHPGISVSIQEGDPEELLTMLQTGHTELALSYHYGLPSEVEGVPLGELPPYVILANNHPLAKRKEITLKQLRDEPFILMDMPHSREYFAELFRRAGYEPNISFKSPSYELIRGLVAQGYGFAIQNAIPATKWTYDGCSVAALPLTNPYLSVEISLIRLRRQATRPAVQAFVEYVQEQFGDAGMFSPGSIQPATKGSNRSRK